MINPKDMKRVMNISFDTETIGLDESHLEVIITALNDQIKVDAKNKHQFRTRENLKAYKKNPMDEIFLQDLTISEIEEKLFILKEEIEDQFPEYEDFSFEEQSIMFEDERVENTLYLVGCKK